MRLSLDVSAVPSRPAGAGRYALELARGLGAHIGSDLHLITRRGDGERWNGIAPQAEVHALVPDSRPLRLVWEQVSMPRHIDRLGVSLHLGPHYTIPERAKVAKIATIHDMFFFDNPEWHEKTKVPVFRRAIKAAVRRAEHLISVSECTERRLRSHFGDVAVTTIALAVDHDRFNEHRSADDLTLLDAMGVRGRFLVFVGTIEPRKNVPALLRVFDQVADQHDDLQLILTGRIGWHREEFEQTLQRMTHRDRVVRTGYVGDDDIKALLGNAGAVVYPSFAEGFGLPALEALACGSTLVTSANSAMSEVTGDAAILVNPFDDSSLRAGVEKALDGGPEIEAMKRLGPGIARGYTWDRTVETHMRLFKKILSEN